MIDIEQKAKGLVLESCLVASSIGSAVGRANICVHQEAGCSFQLCSFLHLLLPHGGPISVITDFLPHQGRLPKSTLKRPRKPS
jgi:hypothetical protein